MSGIALAMILLVVMLIRCIIDEWKCAKKDKFSIFSILGILILSLVLFCVLVALSIVLHKEVLLIGN